MNETPWANSAALEVPASWLDLAPTFGALAASVDRYGLKLKADTAPELVDSLARCRAGRNYILTGLRAIRFGSRLDRIQIGLGANMNRIVIVIDNGLS